MNVYCKKELDLLEEKLSELVLEGDDPIILAETAIRIILDSLSKLKEFIIQRSFKNEEEEIHFFKYLKPQIVAKLIYYNTIYKIETRKPYGAKSTRKYLNKELKKLKRFFDHNLDFYKYYRSNNSFLDEKFFIRGNHDIKLWLDTYYLQSDQAFSTSHDYKVAKIIANDLIQVYLEDQLHNLNKHLLPKHSSTISVNWTGSKTALIELIYALHYQNVFDNSNIDIRLIAKHFENTFNVNLGDFYHTYLELKNRKVNRTKFLDSLRDGLIKKMDGQDEK